MKIVPIPPLRTNTTFKNLVLAVGVFDGLHRGHQKLIKQAIARARKINGTAGVLTFSPHPAQVLDRHFDLSLLVSLAHRLRLMEALGVDVCFVIHFTKAFSRVSAVDFVKKYLSQHLKAKDIFIGCNFHFGRKREGSSDVLKTAAQKYKIRIHAIKPLCCQGDIVSSSSLRTLVAKGNLRLAKKYLGRAVSIFGRVAHGDGRGRRLKFPTANINPGQEILPPRGIYVVEVLCAGQIYQGVANIGFRPSFKKSKKINVEVHIFNFKRNIYGRSIEVRFLKKIRNERKFLRKEHLCEQMERDKQEARRYFLREKHHSFHQ